MKRIVAICLVLSSLAWLVSCSSKDNPSQEIVVPEEQIKKYENGNTLYIPSEDSIGYDDSSRIMYYDNVISVYLFDEIDDSAAQSLADSVNGVIGGRVTGTMNSIQIVVEHTGIDTLNKYADTLMANDNVMYASYVIPVEIQTGATDNNPWSSDGTVITDKNNREGPDGNDWWAEAIGAYTAWSICDDIELSPVTVGISDDYFDLSHEDLSNQISMLKGHENNPIPKEHVDHGTHVSGIILATNNDKGIRGIADKATGLCVNYSGITEEGAVGDGIVINEMQDLINSGSKVVNLSARDESLYTENGIAKQTFETDTVYKKHLNAIRTVGTYDSYLEYMHTRYQRSALQSLIMIVELLWNGKDDFIIVQSAGNGMADTQIGTLATNTGFFASITEDTFHLLSDKTREKLAAKGITYDSIMSHVIIVGAVDNNVDTNGRYTLTTFSNYGSNVSLCAPGKAIYSSYISENGKYGNLDGTSMAAPMVSGSAALLWQIKPDLTASEVKELLIRTSGKTVGVGDDAGTEYPMLNIGNAVRELTGYEDNKDIADTVHVSDAFCYVQALEYDEKGYTCYHIPKIEIDGVDTSAVNEQIYNDFVPELQQQVVNSGSISTESICYKYYIVDNIVTIIVRRQTGVSEYKSYTIDGLNGALMSKEKVINHFGLSLSEFNDGVRSIYKKQTDENREFYSEMYDEEWTEETLSDSNVNAAVPFITEDKNLWFIGNISCVDFDGDVIFDFSNKTKIDDSPKYENWWFECNLDHTGNVSDPSVLIPEGQTYLSSEEALEIACNHWNIHNGDIDPESGFPYGISVSEPEMYMGKMCYKCCLSWLVENTHWSLLDYIYVNKATGEWYQGNFDY